MDKDTYYYQPKKDIVVFKLYGMFPLFLCDNFQSCCLEPVYGIVFLQLFETVADSISGYNQDAGGGWGQPNNYNPITTSRAVSA
jgi:hypothetical protein